MAFAPSFAHQGLAIVAVLVLPSTVALPTVELVVRYVRVDILVLMAFVPSFAHLVLPIVVVRVLPPAAAPLIVELAVLFVQVVILVLMVFVPLFAHLVLPSVTILVFHLITITPIVVLVWSSLSRRANLL
jgi:hypothetical protein